MSDRMQLLEDAMLLITKYTKTQPWRPGLVDLFIYNTVVSMHESDYDDVDNMTYIWNKTPDEVMNQIIDSSRIFDLEYGWDQLDEEVREYMLENNFIAYVDDVSEEEYKTNLEERQ